MKQTPAAIICLAAAILAAAAVTGYSVENYQAGVLLTGFTAAAGFIGVLGLVKACLRDHDRAVDVAGRLEFLEELVYLERLSLERKERLRQFMSSSPIETSKPAYETSKRRSVA